MTTHVAAGNVNIKIQQLLKRILRHLNIQLDKPKIITFARQKPVKNNVLTFNQSRPTRQMRWRRNKNLMFNAFQSFLNMFQNIL
jgi:hypothetical protein